MLVRLLAGFAISAVLVLLVVSLIAGSGLRLSIILALVIGIGLLGAVRRNKPFTAFEQRTMDRMSDTERRRRRKRARTETND